MNIASGKSRLAHLALCFGALITSVCARGAEPCLDSVLSHSSNADRACSDLVAALSYQGATDNADPEQAIALASAFNNRAMARMHSGDLEGAASDLAEAVSLTPSNWAVYLNRGNLHLANTNIQAALADYQRVLELSPDMARSLDLNSVLAWRALGDVQAAEQQLLRTASRIDSAAEGSESREPAETPAAEPAMALPAQPPQPNG